jgi:hypothetical protein
MERVTIGYFGGGLSLRMESAVLDSLLKALSDGGWHDVAVEDGTVRVNLASVVYVRTERADQRVGFGI